MSDKKKKGKYEFVPEMVSTSELQRGAGRVIDAVREGGEPYYVVRNNAPQAVLLSLKEYEKLKKKQRE
jgi:prevent-host-death family protein